MTEGVRMNYNYMYMNKVFKLVTTTYLKISYNSRKNAIYKYKTTVLFFKVLYMTCGIILKKKEFLIL